MKLIKSCDLGRLHELAVETVAKYGENVVTEDGEKTLELQEPLCLVCETPLDEPRYSSLSNLQVNMLAEYKKNLIFGSDCNFEYDYHGRLFHHFDDSEDLPAFSGNNQIRYIVEKLRDCPTSRRGVAITWKPETDCSKKDVPCLQYIQCHLNQKNKLDMMVLFRSNDILLAAGANMYALSALQDYIAKAVGVDVGSYTHIAVIPHIYYERDANDLKRFLEK